MFKKHREVEAEEIFPGVTRRILVDNDDSTMLEISINHGCTVPEHNHPQHKTVGYIVEGQMEIAQEGKKMFLNTGDSFSTPQGAKHSIKALSQVKLIEVFTPRRQDLIR